MKEHHKEKEKYERLYNFNAEVFMKVELREEFRRSMESFESSAKDFKTHRGALLHHEKKRTNKMKVRILIKYFKVVYLKLVTKFLFSMRYRGKYNNCHSF